MHEHSSATWLLQKKKKEKIKKIKDERGKWQKEESNNSHQLKADLAVEQTTKQAQSKQSCSVSTVSVWSLGGETQELQSLIRFSVMHSGSLECVPCTVVTTGGLVCCVSDEAQHAAGFMRHTNLLTEISDTGGLWLKQMNGENDAGPTQEV